MQQQPTSRMGELDITDLLVQEYRDSGERIVRFMLLDERLMATGVTLIGVAASVAIANGKTYFLIAVPTALASLFCFISYVHAETVALGGYRSVLEQALKERLKTQVFGWETFIAPARHRAYTSGLTRLMSIVIFIAAIIAALVEASKSLNRGHWGHPHGTLVVTATSVSVLISLVAVIGTWLYLSREYQHVRGLTLQHLLNNWIEVTDDPSDQ
jgi:hypothetical protein